MAPAARSSVSQSVSARPRAVGSRAGAPSCRFVRGFAEHEEHHVSSWLMSGRSARRRGRSGHGRISGSCRPTRSASRRWSPRSLRVELRQTHISEEITSRARRAFSCAASTAPVMALGFNWS